MQINHRLVTRNDGAFWAEVAALRLKCDGAGGLVVVNVTEDDPSWPAVESALGRHPSVIDQVTNLFTDAELEAAEWLTPVALGNHGYPQPDDDFGYRS